MPYNVNQVNEPPGFLYQFTLCVEVEKLHQYVELTPSWRFRTGGLCSPSTSHTPDEEGEIITGEGHRSSYKTLKLPPAPTNAHR